VAGPRTVSAGAFAKSVLFVLVGVVYACEIVMLLIPIVCCRVKTTAKELLS
jgi:hypothetical protein